MGHILSDSNARATTFGTDSILATRFWTAVKTGTSKDMRDNWAVGWSARYTVGVWVGNASGAPMGQVSGSTGAAPIWAGVMQWLHTQAPHHPPSLAPTRATRPGDTGRGLRAPAGSTATGVVHGRHPAGADAAERQRLTHHRHGNAMPRHPPASSAPPTAPSWPWTPTSRRSNQRLTLKSDAPGLRWRIGQRTVAQGEKALWSPWPGVHRIELVDARGQVLDAVRIEVRGAGLKSSPRGKTKAP